MTSEEIKEYESLSQLGKDYYNIGMRDNPEWNHNQAMTYVQICIITSQQMPNTNGGTVDIKGLFTVILQKTESFMQQNFPRIYNQIKDYFNKAIQWLQNAINVTINKIMELFN